jgi:hypothetical protein
MAKVLASVLAKFEQQYRLLSKFFLSIFNEIIS